MITIALVDIEISWHFDDIPCSGFPIIRKIHKVLVIVQCQRDLIPIESPRTEFHNTSLLIEGEVGDIDGAGALVDSRRNPENLPGGVDQYVRLVTHLVVAIGARLDR